jgi:hypothetical protein
MLSATASPDWQGARAAGGSCSRSVSAERGFCAVGRAVRRRISCGSCLALAAVGSNPATASAQCRDSRPSMARPETAFTTAAPKYLAN